MAPEVLSELQEAFGAAYTIERKLPGGGMGEVYVALDAALERRIVIKVLPADLVDRLSSERFRREIRILAALRHPHIIPLLSSGQVGRFFYYTMPFVPGESLRARLNQERQLPILDSLKIARDMADALSFAHRHEVIHRDIKPDNVLFEEGHALLADFGISRALTGGTNDSITSSGLAIGTPAYMAPEQAAADKALDFRCDIYGVGMVLFEMLAGQRPYTAPTTQALIAKIVSWPVPSVRNERTSVSPSLDSLVTRCLAKVPADRFQSAEELCQFLDVEISRLTTGGAVNHTGSAVSQPAAVHELWAASLKRSGMRWAAAAALILGATGLGWWAFGGTRVEAATLRRVALLPCEDAAPQPQKEFVADRWSEEVIQKLVRVGGLGPKSWLSMKRYRDTKLTPQQIAAELNADALVRCRITELTERVQLDVELIRAADEEVLWADTYKQSGGPQGINTVQSAAVLDIADALGFEGPPRGRAAVEQPLTTDSVALRLYRLGSHYLEAAGIESFRRAAAYFDSALARDPALARAYLGRADAAEWIAELESRPAKEWYPAAERDLRKAVSLDPGLAEAHSLLGSHILPMTFDWAAAEKELRNAVALDPSSWNAHWMLGLHLIQAERLDEALAEFERAKELDPSNRLPRAGILQVLKAKHDDRRLEREVREGLQINPTAPNLRWHLAMLLSRQGKRDSAAAILNREPKNVWTMQGYAHVGLRDTVQRFLDSLTAVGPTQPIDPLHLAMLHTATGNADKALDFLERAYEERSIGLLNIMSRSISFLDDLRNQPRFQALRKKVGFRS